MDAYQQLAIGGGISGRYSPPAVVLDGTNDYLLRGADLSSNANAKTFTMSFWMYPTDITGTDRRIYNNTGNAAHIRIDSATGKLLINMENAAGTQILVAVVDTPLITINEWNHVMMSIDLANSSNRSIYISKGNGATTAATVTWTTYTDDTIDFTVADHCIGATVAGVGPLAAYLADFYLAFGQYIDLTSSANRVKFRSGGRPVFLGADGSKPTGSAPSIFLSGQISDFATNKGTGGGFTVTGALTDANTRP